MRENTKIQVNDTQMGQRHLLFFLFATLVIASCKNTPKQEQPEQKTLDYKIVWTGITSQNKWVGDELPGNAPQYSLDSLETLPDSKLCGKTIYWLGSSITFGLAAHGEATADMLAKHNGCVCYKEATSGTSIAKQVPSDEMAEQLIPIIGVDARITDISYSERVHDLPTQKPDLFVFQMSTNDSRLPGDCLGQISESFDTTAFDLTTTMGGIEYILAYARATWDCPVLLYTSPLYDDPGYLSLVENTKTVAEKWGAYVLDMSNDTAFNELGRANYDLWMLDISHPTRAGYQQWWLPKFEAKIIEVLGL